MELAWSNYFVEHVTPYCGYVTDAVLLDALILEFELATHSVFVIRTTKNKYLQSPSLEELSNRVSKVGSIRWQDTQENGKPSLPCDGIPFVIMGSRTCHCQHGPDRHQKEKEAKRMATLSERESHNYADKHKQLIQPSKKLFCEATMNIRHIIKFPEYKCEEAVKSLKKREQVSAQLRTDLQKGRDVNIEHQFHVLLPQHHTNHVNSEESDAILPIHKKLAKFIHEKVAEDAVYSSRELRLLLAEHLKTDDSLFKNRPLPSRTSTRFWPTLAQIRNHMSLSQLRRRDSSLDQKCLDQLITKWQNQWASDKFFFRQKSEEEKFLFVHQTEWQQTLLRRYGQELCLLDATYRTSKYLLPLFFLAVPTNVNYMVVASFIVENETEKAIEEALAKVRSWNPEWQPRFFMTDKSEEEISAIETVFQDCLTEVYLCDFHRIQAWNRWLATNSRQLQEGKDFILSALKDLAASASEVSFDANLCRLQTTKTWITSLKFRRWFANGWLSCSKKWVKMYRQHRFNVAINTTNGVERQNSTLKWGYLWAIGNQKTQTLSQLVHIMVNRWLPESYQRYVHKNAASSSNNRAYSADVPSFLHDRPAHFIKHEMQRWHEAQDLLQGIEAMSKEGNFLVKSATHIGLRYKVVFDDNHGYPDCECVDWKRHHYPCKHMLAVIASPAFPTYSWNSLADTYRTSVFINLHVTNDVPASPPSPGPYVAEIENTSSCSQEQTTECEDTSQPDKMQLALLGRKLRSVLQSMVDLSHVCTNVDVLANVVKQLQPLQKLMHDSSDHEGPFLKEPRPSVPIPDRGSRLRLRRGSKRNMNRSRPQSMTSVHRAARNATMATGDVGSAPPEVQAAENTPSREMNSSCPTPVASVRRGVLAKLKPASRKLNSSGRFTCEVCSCSFIYRKDLIGHNTKFHPDGNADHEAIKIDRNIRRFERMKQAARNATMATAGSAPQEVPADETEEAVQAMEITPSRGLKNLGNTCFFNAVIQCLRQTSHLVHGLQNYHQNKTCDCFLCKLKGVICQGQQVNRSLLQGLRKKWKSLEIGTQQCAAECLTHVIEAVDAGTRMRHFGIGAASAAFQSALEYENTCKKCNWKLRPNLDGCHQINLPVLPNKNLSQILEEEFLHENLDGFKCRDSKCGAVEVERQCKVVQPPNALVIHLKRYRNDGTKIADPVDLTHTMDIPTGGQPARYSLYGVVVHNGRGSRDGHYVAFVKKGEKWWKMDDNQVTPSKWEYVRNSCATLLFLAPACVQCGKSCETVEACIACAAADCAESSNQMGQGEPEEAAQVEQNIQPTPQTRKRKFVRNHVDPTPCSKRRDPMNLEDALTSEADASKRSGEVEEEKTSGSGSEDNDEEEMEHIASPQVDKDTELPEKLKKILEKRIGRSKKLLEYMTTEHLQNHLHQIKEGKVSSIFHRKFLEAKKKASLNCMFGPITDDDQQDQLMAILSNIYKKIYGSGSLLENRNYLLSVWAPEAVLFSLIKVEDLSRNDALKLVCEGPHLTKAENLHRHCEIISSGTGQSHHEIKKAEKKYNMMLKKLRNRLAKY